MDIKLNTEGIIKLIMAIAMLICLLPMPYGYYQMVRLGSAIGFSYLAYNLKSGESNMLLVYIGLAILFQPIIKISLGRTLWNIVDLVVGIWLILSVYKNGNKAV
ncbi:MAG: hypothetical protein IPJ09_09220 [Saprospiraceae bacterium]|nr:hypothetical protein [Saprospiraceae bacterium]